MEKSALADSCEIRLGWQCRHRVHAVKPWMIVVICGAVAAAAMPGGSSYGAAVSVAAASCKSSQFITVSSVKVLRDCQTSPQMIPLHGGAFRMGDQVGDGQPYELPVHVVNVAPFALGRFEVTLAEWKACVDAGACPDSGDPIDESRGSYPVEAVSWNQSKGYADWLSKLTGKSYRLPSEAEWEYAARARATGRSPWNAGDEACKWANLLDVSGNMEHKGWYWFERCDDKYSNSAPVGSFPPNAWGFHDMLGNVWEWVADCWHPDYSGAPSTAVAWIESGCRKHVNRGGGWGNNQRSLRFSNRDADPATAHGVGLGFRIARDLSTEEIRRFSESAPDAAAPAGLIEVKASPAPAAGSKPVQETIPPTVLALARERAFEIHFSVHGQQSWSKPPQHGDGITDQDVILKTRLRSDGVLYHDNLVDPDPAIRIAVKQRYQERQGLLRIMAMTGGKIPSTPAEINKLAGQVEAQMNGCLTDSRCAGDVFYLAAGLEALRNNPPRDLEVMAAPPPGGPGAKWLYYFGYPGCPGTIHVINHTHVTGERSIWVGGSHLVPWEVERNADSRGSDEDRQQLCQRYVVTANVQTGDVYLENLYIPPVSGVTVRSRDGKARRTEDNFLLPSAVLIWAGEKLRKAGEANSFTDNLPATAPFDEDYTILGHFEGQMAVRLDWSFKPAAIANDSSPQGR